MRAGRTIRARRGEAGIALLIAIFVLLLIGVVAIALIVSSGTETALAGNYRSSTSVYYAAVAGLEEVRARLRVNNPNSFQKTNPTNFLPAPGTPLPVCSPVYLINALGSETVAPWDLANAYYDKEFNTEFSSIGGCTPQPNPSPSAASIWNRSPLNSLSFPGPLYKWVRINGVSEQSLNLDVDGDNQAQSTTPLYFDNTNNRFSNNAGAGPQLLELTAFAVLPNGSQKMLQYLVAPSPVTLPPFLAALTISGSGTTGNSPVFHAPANNAVYAVKGDNQDCSGNPGGNPVAAIGLFGDYSGYSYGQDLAGIVNGIPSSVGGPPPTNPQQNYTGWNSPPPDVEYLTAYPTNMQTPAELNGIVQAITQNADVVLPSSSPPTYPLPTVTGSALNSLGMSATSPLTVVINGNLDVTNWSGTGYGLLLVIGKFTYDPDTTWNGIILVIGQGAVGDTAHGQYQQINGAMLVAKTLDASGNLWAGRIGGGSVSFDPTMQGNGVRYSSCWIQKSVPTSGYKILSFHEISQ